MMTKKLFLFSLIACAFAACQKEESMTPSGINQDNSKVKNPINSSLIGPVPATLTRKVLIESYTSASSPKAPMNDYLIQTSMKQYPGKVIASEFHINDAMQHTASYDVLGFLSNGTVPVMPAVMLSRTVFNSKLFNDDLTWPVNVSNIVVSTINTGLAIESTVSGNQVQATIHVGFNASVSGSYRMVAYLVENNVTGMASGYSQSNGFNNLPGNPFYNAGNPITNYRHTQVVRSLLTPVNGVAIPAGFQVTGGHMMHDLTFDVGSNINLSEASVVCYVYNTSNLEVMNVQIAKLGTVQDWD